MKIEVQKADRFGMPIRPSGMPVLWNVTVDGKPVVVSGSESEAEKLAAEFRKPKGKTFHATHDQKTHGRGKGGKGKGGGGGGGAGGGGGGGASGEGTDGPDVENAVEISNYDNFKDEHQPDDFSSFGAQKSFSMAKNAENAERFERADELFDEAAKKKGVVSAYSDYQGSGYIRTNASLRNSKGDPSQLSESQKEKIGNMDAAFSETPALINPIVVHRGTDVGFSSMSAGDSFTDHGYTSTSTDGERAKFFGSTQMKITIPRGSRVVPITAVTGGIGSEAEIVLPRGTKFVFTKVAPGSVEAVAILPGR